MRAAQWFTSALIGSLGFAAGAGAQEGPAPMVSASGSVAVVSDYSFRGISQTQKEVAIQGGIEIAGPSGLYLGTWGSSLNFGEADGVVRAQAETDIYGGIRPSLAGTTLDLGFVFYGYPGTDAQYDYNFIEFALGASRSYSTLTVGAKAYYSPDYFAASGSSLYLVGSAGVSIPNTPLSLAGTVGHQSIDDNSAFGTPDYLDWSAGATLNVIGLKLGAAAVGTDLDQAECFAGSELCKTRLVLSVAR